MKKRYLKNFTVLIISAALLCGCSSADNAETETSETVAETVSSVSEASVTETESETVTEAVIPPMDTSPITFTLFLCGTENFPTNSPAIAEITIRTGVTLEITSSDSEALDILIAAGEVPDLIYAGDSTDGLISDGTLLPLDDYVSKFGENFSALYGDRLDSLRSDDGKLYTFGTGGSSPAEFYADGSFQIRYDVLKALDYPEIKTLEQFGDCLRQYKELYPSSTGLLLCGSPHQQWLDTVSARVNYVLGYPDDGEFLVDEKTGEAVYKWTDPRTKDFIKWLNGLYNDGLLDDKSFSLKHDAYLDRLKNGNNAAIADYYEDYSSAQDDLISWGGGKAYCPLPVTLNGDVKSPFFADYGYAPKSGIGISSSCKDPERAFRFMDWLCGDEAQLLMNFGTEVVFDPYAEANVIAEPFPMRGLTEKTSDGQFYSYSAEKYASERPEAEKAVAEAYGVTVIADLFPHGSEFETSDRTLISDMEIPAVSETAILLEMLENYIKTEVPGAITAPAEEFDRKWKEITDWCEKNGADRLGELMTETVKENMGI